jgi:hypothetical protein
VVCPKDRPHAARLALQEVLSSPLLSVSAAEWVRGNPFNGIVFVALFLILFDSRVASLSFDFRVLASLTARRRAAPDEPARKIPQPLRKNSRF